MHLIETKNLNKTYQDAEINTVGLDNISIRIDEGEFVAITGPSGSGKSTLLQVLGCLDRPTSGQYLIDGKPLDSYSDNELAEIRNKKMGFVFQAFNLLPRQSVLDNVKMPLVYAGVKEPRRTEVAQKMVDMVGLNDRKDYKTAKLSGGQKQRVAIARALVNNPKIIFADEPTGNLDSKSGQQIMEIIQDLNDQGKTIILVTHESDTAEHAKRVLKIKDGIIVADIQVLKQRLAKEGELRK